MKNFEKIKDFNVNYNTDNMFLEFIKSVGSFFETSVCQLENLQDDDYFNKKSLQELEEINKNQFSQLSNIGYYNSFLNPNYSCRILGNEFGPILSSYFYSISNCLKYAYRKNASYIDSRLQQFFKLVDLLNSKDVSKSQLISLLNEFELENLDMNELLAIEEDYPCQLNIETDICLNSDLLDLRYLYKYGIPISKNEIEFSYLMSTYSQDDIDKIAQHIVNSYLEGFKIRNKDRKNRNTSRIVSIIGLERVTKSIIKNLESRGLSGYSVVNYAGIANTQVSLDHQEDISLFLDDVFTDAKIKSIYKAHAACIKPLSNYMGNIICLSFGQEIPNIKYNKFKLTCSDSQKQLLKSISLYSKKSFESYVPKAEVSYTGMAFPCSDIGDNYSLIFDEVLKMNLVDPKPYLKIQNTLIEALDKGKYAVIKGQNGNKTNLKVSLQTINNPSCESNFMSCGSDVNIPVGEVYTSPKLAGTNGVLHVKEIVVSKKVYKDLLVEIKDGYVVDFSCSNFDDHKQNKEYIQNNLFASNSTLTVGEFAIGTNTYAYATSKKLNIINKLHTLIVEKMGPHIALGDTCCAWNEETVFTDTISKKKFTAFENEKSAQRKCDLSNAYYNVHKDITIPYDDVESISIFTEDNTKITIIENGKFVLPGCEYLNIPLEA